MKFFLHATLLLLTLNLVTGCAMNNDDAKDNGDTNTKVQNYRVNENRQMQVADEAQIKTENLDEVRHANVIVTNRNAYVAVVLENESKGDVRKELEDKISDQVKSSDESILNVYVSSNPDFVDRMSDYADEIQSGRPLGGLVEEFTEMVQRVFPTAR
jgi:spore cortex protein